MAGRRRKKSAPKNSVQAHQPGPLAYRPFRTLKGLKIKGNPSPAPARPPESPPQPLGGTDLFHTAMADVTPLSGDKTRVTRKAPPAASYGSLPLYSEDLEVLARLEALVAGRAQFDLADTDEYVEGFVRGIHPLLLEKLRQGRFSVQAHLDLHGLSVPEAEEAVRDFIDQALARGYRCVLLVHGRGLNSRDHVPVLKKRLRHILLRGPVRKKILAFTTARPVDGGAGASYVLLRARS